MNLRNRMVIDFRESRSPFLIVISVERNSGRRQDHRFWFRTLLERPESVIMSKVPSNPDTVLVNGLWDKENADLPIGYPIESLVSFINTALKQHDSRFMLNTLTAYGPNLPSERKHGIDYVCIPKESVACQAEFPVVGQCLKLVVEKPGETKVRIMRSTDVADKYLTTDLCLQLGQPEKRPILIIAGDGDYLSCFEEFPDSYLMLAEPKNSNRTLRVSAKVAWTWSSEDNAGQMISGGGLRHGNNVAGSSKTVAGTGSGIGGYNINLWNAFFLLCVFFFRNFGIVSWNWVGVWLVECLIQREEKKFFFPKLRDADIVYSLQLIASKEEIEIEKDALKLIASRSDGSLRDAEFVRTEDLCSFGSGTDTVNTVKKLRTIMETSVEPLALMSQLATVITDILAVSKEDMEKLRQALKTLSEAEKQLRVSNDKLTWLTAALLHLAPDQNYLLHHSSTADSSLNRTPLPLENNGGRERESSDHHLDPSSDAAAGEKTPTVHSVFSSPLKSTAEKFRGHIMQAFEAVLESPVTIEITSETKRDTRNNWSRSSLALVGQDHNMNGSGRSEIVEVIESNGRRHQQQKQEEERTERVGSSGYGNFGTVGNEVEDGNKKDKATGVIETRVVREMSVDEISIKIKDYIKSLDVGVLSSSSVPERSRRKESNMKKDVVAVEEKKKEKEDEFYGQDRIVPECVFTDDFGFNEKLLEEGCSIDSLLDDLPQPDIDAFVHGI
uniref:Uncharacterized protein n=1 Tax=Brassica campestris TaxID=3711 RepID=A0A3P5ZJI2_BRACM|nr:unnamed protein product [Brassica rapa]